MRTEEPAVHLYVRLASQSDLDALEARRGKAGARSVAEYVRNELGLTPMSPQGRPSSNRATRKRLRNSA